MAMISSTVKEELSPGDCPATPMRRPRRLGGRAERSLPPIPAFPRKGIAPPRALSRVLFPLPLGPRMKVSFPEGKEPETFVIASLLP